MVGQRVTDELTVNKFSATATGIKGAADNLHRSLAELEAELKKDHQGRKEFEDYLATLKSKRADLQKRVAANKAWVQNFESNDTAGAFEAQYKQLLAQIDIIYSNAKEFHGKGIEMLIKEFNYHLAYKRWNDTFTATPFKPK